MRSREAPHRDCLGALKNSHAAGLHCLHRQDGSATLCNDGVVAAGSYSGASPITIGLAMAASVGLSGFANQALASFSVSRVT